MRIAGMLHCRPSVFGVFHLRMDGGIEKSSMQAPSAMLPPTTHFGQARLQLIHKPPTEMVEV